MVKDNNSNKDRDNWWVDESDLIYGKFTRGYLQQPGKYLTASGSKNRTLRSTGLYWVAPGPYMSQ